MKYRYDFVCKLITNLKKTRNVNTNIIENNEKFTNTDIRYLILTLLMNSGMLFEKKFSDNNWFIDRNDFTGYCTWRGLDGNYSNIMEEPDWDKIEDEITDWSFLDEESGEEVLVEEDYYNRGDDYIIPIFKGPDGNVSGSKVMNQIRNKLFHNQFSDYDCGIVLKFNEGELEIEDEDIYAMLNSYLKACINTKVIKQLLYLNTKFLDKNYIEEEKNVPDQRDILKINEIVSMFQFLYLMVSMNSKLDSYSKIEESLMPFNNILNSINEVDTSIINSISQPDYEKAQVSSLFSIIFVMSDLKKIDLSSINLNFLNIDNNFSKSNDNVIRHIRNSFAHGYYVYQEDNIIIEDYNKGVKTFSASCSVSDLIDFSLSQNILGKMYDTQNNVGLKK